MCAVPLPVFAYNTAGSMLHVDPAEFDHPNLVSVTWTTEISEYEHRLDPFRYRIEFDSVGFRGSAGVAYVCTMIQNVGHEFENDIVGSRDADPPSIVEFPALGIYFSSLRADWPEEKHGVQLLVNPSDPPRFGRVFEDVDSLGYIGRNIYTRNPLPDPPLTIVWTVNRVGVVQDPSGNLAKNAAGNWVPLQGTFVVWRFCARIGEADYTVADYYLPMEYAEYIFDCDPLVLHQEYFGSSEEILDAQKCSVRFSEMWASDGQTSYPLEEWMITWRIDDESGNLDNRFGWTSDVSGLISRVGHESDVSECKRDPGHTFSIKMTPPTAATFRVTSEGYVLSDGVLRASAFVSGFADVAEWVTVTAPVEPGDVVELNPDRPQVYQLSTNPCSSLVAGVVSTEPGVVLGEDGAYGQRALLALTGIVPVKVTNESGPIQPGDLLVSSSTPGHAMRRSGSNPCSCVLIGKALEPMTSRTGVILVLLTAH